MLLRPSVVSKCPLHFRDDFHEDMNMSKTVRLIVIRREQIDLARLAVALLQIARTKTGTDEATAPRPASRSGAA
jgi:hypothetical protein